jgi:hypothetical protein
MEPRMRRLLHGDERQPLLSRAFLLAQRRSEVNPFLTKKMRMKKIYLLFQRQRTRAFGPPAVLAPALV